MTEANSSHTPASPGGRGAKELTTPSPLERVGERMRWFQSLFKLLLNDRGQEPTAKGFFL